MENEKSIPIFRHLWQPLAISAALAFTYATVLAKLGRDWWADPNYSHGLLILFVIGVILWVERKQLMSEPARPSFLWGGASVILALLALWGRDGGSRTLYAADVSGADAGRDRHLVQGFSFAPLYVRATRLAGPGRPNPGNHL